METPRNAEGRGAIDVGTTELDEVLEHDSPSDGPLLNGDKATTNGGGGDFRLVDGDYCRSEADGDASDDPTDDEHSTGLRKFDREV